MTGSCSHERAVAVAMTEAAAVRVDAGALMVVRGDTQQSTAVEAVDAGASAAQVLAGNAALAATGVTEIPMEALTVHADASASATTLPSKLPPTWS